MLHTASPWLLAGAAGLGALALRSALLERSRRALAWTLCSIFLGLLALTDVLGHRAWDVALLGLAAQALLEGRMAPRPGRALRAGGHLLLGLAALLALLQGPAAAGTVLAYAGGLSVLLLRAQWSGQQRRPAEAGWGLPFLALLTVGLGAVSLAYTAQLARLAWAVALAPLAIRAALVIAVPLLALACRPPAPPAWLRREHGPGVDVVAHGAAAIAMLNILFLTFSLVSGWSLRLLFGALFGWQMLVIFMEYRTVRHAERRRRAPPKEAAPQPPERITVIVPACNEAQVLPASMAQNLAVDYPLDFLLVPAAKSTDGTVAVAQRIAAQSAGRVRVLVGRLGSKARELNQAWEQAATRYVLLLDADETIDRPSLEAAVAVLHAHPEVGVVQGRKVSRAPDAGFLARLVSAERRYCTWMDHVMHSEDLGSGHFGGSAALVRREVAPDVGGWTDRTLTEDIEFTLRLHLHGKWRIAYLPEMVVRESDPATAADLFRQRTRWARGWAQCLPIYLPQVVRRRARLGRRRAFGLALLLTVSVSALWTTFLPASILMRLAGVSPLLPVAVMLPVTLLLLPSRLLAYGYAALRDPVIPLRRKPGRLAELALQAYLWILLGWFVQLHALYLELSAAPRLWTVTAKRALGAAA